LPTKLSSPHPPIIPKQLTIKSNTGIPLSSSSSMLVTVQPPFVESKNMI
jgi:hypothetical protein